MIESQLLPFKQALYDTNMVEFYAHVSENDRHHFNDHSQLLEHIRNQILPICNSSRGYYFYINFISNENSVSTMMASILKQSEIIRCSNIEIEFAMQYFEQKQLPIEEISCWLKQSACGIENSVQNLKKRFLELTLFVGIQNAQDLLEFLTKVRFVYLFKNTTNYLKLKNRVDLNLQ